MGLLRCPRIPSGPPSFRYLRTLPITNRVSNAPADEKYLGLRLMALHSSEDGLTVWGPSCPWISGAVVDIPSAGGFATLVALTDRTTSLYTSVGGGTIGLGSDQLLAEATQRLLAVIESHLGGFWSIEDDGFPIRGLVRIHVLLPQSRRVADVPEDNFWGKAPHPLTPVIAAVQRVVAALRPFQ